MTPPFHPALLLARLLGVLLSAFLVLGLAPPAHAAPIEDYATYQAGTKCRPKDKPGMVFLGHWMVEHYGGSYGGVGRACSSSTSEHEEGRAFDWTLDATHRKDRVRAGKFMARIFATDAHDHTDAWARRMGVMYVIWNDRIYSAWSSFEPSDYLSSSCPSLATCSPTLRHRDHLHISLTRAGGRGATSWFEGRMPRGAGTRAGGWSARR